MTMLRQQIRPALTLTLALCVVTGMLYPGVVTGLAQLLFPWQANGSMVEVNGRVVGSALIAQPFREPWYFHPRPSAAGSGYDAASSAGSNRGPTDRTLDSLIASAVDTVVSRDGATRGQVPSDMVTRSASGLDPHISPANAYLQVARVAATRNADTAAIRHLVDAHVEQRQFGVLGEPRVNVLLLNVAVDRSFPHATPTSVRGQP